MTEGQDANGPDGRMETLLPGVPVISKIALGLGVAGGLFGAIVASYNHPEAQYVVLILGIAIGIIAAIVLAIRSRTSKPG